MIKQLGVSTYFLTLSCTYLLWDGLSYIINKLNNEELKNLSYEECCKLHEDNPFLVARHFYFQVQVFFKKVVLADPLEKIKYYALPIEFQERGSPHVHAFVFFWGGGNFFLFFI